VSATEEVAAGADLLIHEATFASDEADRARSTGHTTAPEAGRLARRAGVKRLALTHISSRYAGDASEIAREAAAAFDGDAVVAHDGLEIEVPFPDA
jgi:ribonuclease Z